MLPDERLLGLVRGIGDIKEEYGICGTGSEKALQFLRSVDRYMMFRQQLVNAPEKPLYIPSWKQLSNICGNIHTYVVESLRADVLERYMENGDFPTFFVPIKLFNRHLFRKTSATDMMDARSIDYFRPAKVYCRARVGNSEEDSYRIMVRKLLEGDFPLFIANGEMLTFPELVNDYDYFSFVDIEELEPLSDVSSEDVKFEKTGIDNFKRWINSVNVGSFTVLEDRITEEEMNLLYNQSYGSQLTGTSMYFAAKREQRLGKLDTKRAIALGRVLEKMRSSRSDDYIESISSNIDLLIKGIDEGIENFNREEDIELDDLSFTGMLGIFVSRTERLKMQEYVLSAIKDNKSWLENFLSH